MSRINTKLWSPFEETVDPDRMPAKMSGNRHSTPGGGPNGSCVHGGNEPACSGTKQFPATRVAIKAQIIDEGSEQNPYVGIDLGQRSSIALTSKMKVWFRNVLISATGDVYMSANMLVFLVWLWQVSRRDQGRPFHVDPGWLKYPYTSNGVCEWVQDVLKATWPPASASASTLITVATKERIQIGENRGGRHCRENLPFLGLKLTQILRDSPIEMQRWLRDLVQDHPPSVAFAIGGLRVSRLSGLAGARRDRNRADADYIGRLAVIDPLAAIVAAHGIQNGESNIGSQNFKPMFERLWRNQPGGLTDRRAAQLVDLLDFPLRLAGDVGCMLHTIWKMGTIDTAIRYPEIQQIIGRFRRWLSSAWIPSLRGHRNSPCVSIEPSYTVFRSPAMVDVLAALERQDLRITLMPAVVDRVADARALVAAAELPKSLAWLKKGAWTKPCDAVQSGKPTVKLVSTVAAPVLWSDLRQYVVAEVPEVVVVLRPARAIQWYHSVTSGCEYDLLRWTGVIAEPAPGDQNWHHAHVELGTRRDSSCRSNLLPVEGADATECDLARAKLAVTVDYSLVSEHVDAAMRTTAPFQADATAASRERVAIARINAGGEEPAAKRARVFTEAE